MFRLSKEFLSQYENKQPAWGILGYPTFKRTYARVLEDGTTEEFFDTVKRVVEGCFNIQYEHCKRFRLPWNAWKAQKSAQKMFDKMWNFKFLPPGRGLWLMGTDVVDKIGSAGLNNCGFVSTKDLKSYPSRPFKFLMDMSMLGVGVGFDVLGAGEINIQGNNKTTIKYEIADTREAWVESLGLLLNHYFLDTEKPIFDYSKIRPQGTPIKGFGGTASGPQPLKDLHKNIETLFKGRKGKPITSEHIVDIMNYIGVCVVAGNVRRTAEIALGPITDKTYIDLKLDQEKLGSHRWASNNSVLAEKGMKYSDIITRVQTNGEPGFVWLDNIQTYGRMKDGKNYKDYRAQGTNPSLRKGTKVITSSGIFPIELLENRNIKVPNLNGQLSPAKCFLSGKNKPLWKITLGNGQDYYCTEEHKWPIYTPQGYVKSTTLDLKPGHMLPLLQKTNLEFGNLGNYSDGFLVGWLYGDGNITKRKDNGKLQYNFVVSKKDCESGIDEIILNKLRSITKTNLNWVIRESTFELATTNKLVHEFFSSFGTQSKGNGLPTKIWSECSENFRKGFVDGIFSADGCVESSYKNCRLSIGQSKEKLIKELSELLGFYGIKHSTKKQIIKNVSFPNGKSYDKEYKRFTIQISNRAHIKHFNDCFKFTHLEKAQKLQSLAKTYKLSKINDFHYKIVNVEKTNLTEDVWDITVYDDTHCFQLSQCLTGNCGEQSLESFELCCLVETFPSLHESKEEYFDTLKYAYMYAKSVTLINTHWAETNAVMLRNRRIGTSQTGIIQAFGKHGRRKMLSEFCDEGYTKIQEIDKKYSDWLCIPRSIKTTTVKPSGTVSLLSGVSPGIHYPHSEYYIRRIRFDKDDLILKELEKAGYKTEPCVYSKTSTVVEFPVKEDNFYKGKKEVSVWEQLENAAQYQHYWSDNQVSITVDVTENDFDDMAPALELYESRLKSVSFLPYKDHGYKQPPYEEIDKKTYEKMSKKLKPYDLSKIIKPGFGTKFCDGDVCEIVE